MKFTAQHLKRYKEIGRLFWKYGRSNLVRKTKSAEEMGTDDLDEAMDESGPDPEELVKDLEAMGPTYVKFGQVLASRPDLLPETYLKALSRLQDSVKPFSEAEAMDIVEKELGVRISKAFTRFDPEPIAAASLGQVHYAELRDGRKVVVKVQRPNVREQVGKDFEALGGLAAALDAHTPAGKKHRFREVVEEFRTALARELNYEMEAQNLIVLGRNLAEFPHIVVPQPVRDYCTRSVLTMEYVDGDKITALSPLARQDLDSRTIIDELFKAYLKQVLVDGLFHADPHPGNVFITRDNRIALIDLGMVGHTTPSMQEHLLKLLLAISEGNGDEAAEVVFRISERMEESDQAEFRRQVTRLVAAKRDQGLEQMNVGRSLFDVSNRARANGFFVPSELTLLGKTLLQLDEVGRTLDPSFNPTEAIQRHVTDLMSRRVRKDLTRGNFFSSVLETKDFVQALPGRVNRILDAVSNSELELKVKAVDAKVMLDGMQKIANRITAGLVLAALIVGASLLMRVQTRFELFGYPGLAILCFMSAAGGAFWLVINIFVQDYKSQKKVPRSGKA
ncbi:MAG TPA: AarF/ABC1/UbiB kinase family protein [Lacunisphaera sp.]|nr:AarF/ABC1/UbiB kinase family protein [Lacunisphaera sp.]